MNGDEERRELPERGRHQWQPDAYGKSVLGQDLEVWMPATASPRFLIMAGLHGEEPETTVVLSRALRTLSRRPAHAAVILAANPDGLIRGTRGNARGVDLNRNFPCQSWQGAPITHRWVVEEPSQVKLSPGTFPASEPEVSALVELINRVNPEQVITIHAPLACIDDPEDSPVGNWISRRCGLPLVKEIGYPTPGSFGTWAAERSLPVITYEFPRKSVEHLVQDHFEILVELMMGKGPVT